MTKYHAIGFKPADATSLENAAEIFAARQARKLYGDRGYCHHVRLDCWTADGRSANAEAFIGVDADGGCRGNNVNIYITKM